MRSLELNVARVESRCPLWVDRHLIEQLPTLLDLPRYSTIVVVADRGAGDARARLLKTLRVSESAVLLIEGGESQKCLEELTAVWRFFAEQKIDRRSLVIVIGGGATTDLVGFAAATYMRGVSFINIPTTLLAQVDASIGGKVGVNFAGVKNLLGSIAQPAGVVIDIEALATLPERELRSGFAEVVKHGLIADRAYFTLATSRSCGEWSGEELVALVYRSCEIKRSIVESDETEQGLRKTLNFGHSIGHAIEALYLSGGQHLTHGEAISIGMYGEAYISHRVGKISAEDLTSIKNGLRATGLPTHLPTATSTSALRELLSRDKKNVSGLVKWTLLEEIGRATFDVVVPEEYIADALTLLQPTAREL